MIRDQTAGWCFKCWLVLLTYSSVKGRRDSYRARRWAFFSPVHFFAFCFLSRRYHSYQTLYGVYSPPRSLASWNCVSLLFPPVVDHLAQLDALCSLPQLFFTPLISLCLFPICLWLVLLDYLVISSSPQYLISYFSTVCCWTLPWLCPSASMFCLYVL